MQTAALSKPSFAARQNAKTQAWPGILTPSAGEVRVLGSYAAGRSQNTARAGRIAARLLPQLFNSCRRIRARGIPCFSSSFFLSFFQGIDMVEETSRARRLIGVAAASKIELQLTWIFASPLSVQLSHPRILPTVRCPHPCHDSRGALVPVWPHERRLGLRSSGDLVTMFRPVSEKCYSNGILKLRSFQLKAQASQGKT